MKNIIRIARNDIHNIRKNVIALIVIFGITIVPSLYAWFNIAASWDPYKNTGNLKVAVASLDKGYDGELLPVRLNLGNDIISSLRENTQLHWIFTDAKDASNGVRSGKYYASVVISLKHSQQRYDESVFLLKRHIRQLLTASTSARTPSPQSNRKRRRCNPSGN